MASFSDTPEAITGAETRQRALLMAADALATAITHYLDIGRSVPLRSAGSALPHVALDPAVAARVLLTKAMSERGLTKPTH